MKLAVVTLAVSLLAVPVAGAELVRPQKVTDMAALVAGRNVDVACETDSQAWDALVAERLPGRSGRLVNAFYTYAPVDQLRLSPLICAHFEGRNMGALGRSLQTLAHEAAHARGVVDEAWADCWGLFWAQDLARRFYGVEFFTPESLRVGAAALEQHRSLGPEYQGAC